MAREIKCSSCGKHLGVIRDAKLARGIDYRCKSCAASARKDDFPEFMDNLFKYRRSK